MFTRIFEDVAALLVAAVVLIVGIAYFGTTPIERAVCDIETKNVPTQITCMYHAATN